MSSEASASNSRGKPYLASVGATRGSRSCSSCEVEAKELAVINVAMMTARAATKHPVAVISGRRSEASWRSVGGVPGYCCSGGTAGYLEAGKDVFEVLTDRVLANVQQAGDLAVGAARGDQLQNLCLARG